MPERANYGIDNVWVGAPIDRVVRGGSAISSLGQDITVYWDAHGPFGYGWGRQPYGLTPYGGSFPEIFSGYLIEVYMTTPRGEKALVRRTAVGPRAINFTYREDDNRYDAARLGHVDFQAAVEIAVGVQTTLGKGGTYEAGASARVTTVDGGPIPVTPRHTHALDDLSDVNITGLVNGHALVWDATGPYWKNAVLGGGGGVTDHGLLTGLFDDDHLQYIYATPADSNRNAIQSAGNFVAWRVLAAVGQTVDLTQWFDASSNLIAKVTVAGKIFGFGLDAGSQKITNVATPTNPTDGVNKAYADGLIVGGGDHGTLTGLTDDDHLQYAHTAPGTAARNRIQPTAVGVIPIQVVGAASTIVDFQNWSSSTTLLARVLNTGQILAYGFDASSQKIVNVALPTNPTDGASKTYVDSQDTNTAALAILRAPGASATNVLQPSAGTALPLTIKAHASQATDLQNWQSSAAAVLAKVTVAGKIFGTGFDAGSQIITNVLTPANPTDAATKGYVDGLIPTVITEHSALDGLAGDDHTQYVIRTPGSDARATVQSTLGVVPFIVKAHVSQTVDLQTWQSSAAAVLARVTSAGKIFGTGMDAGSQIITNVATPSVASDGANKGYVDTGDTAAITSALGGAVILAPGTSAKNTVQPTGAAIIPLTLKGFASQTADLQEWQSSAAAVLAKVTSAGKFFAVGLDAGSQKVENVALCTVGPDGANKTYVDAQDTATAGLAVLKAPGTSLTNIVQPGGATIIPITVRGFASQTGNLIEFQSSAAAILARVTSAGKIFGTGIDAGSQLITNVLTPAAATDAATKNYVDTHVFSHSMLADTSINDDHPQYIYFAPDNPNRNVMQAVGDFVAMTFKSAGGSEHITQWIDSTGSSTIAGVTANGQVFGSGLSAMGSKVVGVATPTVGSDAANKTYVDGAVGSPTGAVILLPTTSARNTIQPSGAAFIPLTVKGFASQSADLQNWQSSAAAVLAKVTSVGKIHGVGLDAGSQLITNVLTPSAGTDAANKTYVDGAVGSPTGAVILAPAASTRNVIQPTGAAFIPLTVRGFASQSADLQNWQNSGSTVLAKVTSAGKVFGIGLDAGSQLITNVLTPSAGTDAVNKTYADALPAANGISNLQLRDSVALSLIGRSANSGGDPGDIATTALSNAVMRESGSTIGWGLLGSSNLAAAAGITRGQLANGTALSVVGVTGAVAGALADIATTNGSGMVIREAGGSVGWGLIANANISAAAGINKTKFENSAALSIVGRSANSIGALADIATTAASNAVLRESGSAIGWGLLASANLSASAGITNGQLANSLALSLMGRSVNSVGVVSDIAAGSGSNTVMRESGGTIGWGLLSGASMTNNAIGDAQLRGGLACSVVGRSANSVGNVADIASTADGQVLARKAGVVGWYAPSARTIHQRFFDVPSMWGEATVGTPTLVQTNPTTFNATSGAVHFAGLLMGDLKITWIRFAFSVPADHAPGTGFTMRICFVLNSAGSGAVDFALIGAYFNDNDFSAGGSTFFGGATVNVAAHGGSDYVIVDMTPVSLGLTAGQYVQGVIQRDARVANALDTYPDLIGVAWITIRGSQVLATSLEADDTEDDDT